MARRHAGEIFARANVYNALQYNGDPRSLITNLITGSGNDTIKGNAADNTIDGNGAQSDHVRDASAGISEACAVKFRSAS